MPSHRNWWLAAAFALVLAAGAWMVSPVESVPLPASRPPLAVSATDPTPVTSWLGPWALPRTPRPLAAKVEPAPEFTPRVDRAGLTYIGTVVTEENEKRYFFKVRQTGQLLSLVPGSRNSGWTLISVQDKLYQIEGPEGLYEVAR